MLLCFDTCARVRRQTRQGRRRPRGITNLRFLGWRPELSSSAQVEMIIGDLIKLGRGASDIRRLKSRHNGFAGRVTDLSPSIRLADEPSGDVGIEACIVERG